MKGQAGIAILAAFIFPVTALSGESPLPAPVAKFLKGYIDTCADAQGKPNTAKAVQRADLNADGFLDFVVDVGSIECVDAFSIYGDREKDVGVFLGDGKGSAVQAFGDSVFGVRVEGQGTKARLWLTTSGAGCGKRPAKDFASENFCDRPLSWNAATRKLEYAPVSQVKMIQ